MKAVQVLERLSIVAPLGLRFRDQVTGAFVSDGLSVWLFKPNRPASKVPARPNHSGVFVVHQAQGLIDFEHGPGDDEFWKNAPPRKSFVVAVTDSERRFQPFQFTADLPARGIFNWVNAFGESPPARIPSVPLYSTPVRNVPAGMAVIRADLWDAANDIPAAWAILEAYTNNRLVGRGMADEKGRMALIFPHQAPRPFSILSPPGSPIDSPPAAIGPPLINQVWPITLRAMYEPLGEWPSLPGEFGRERQLADLSLVLSQREALLWADTDRTQPLGEVALRFGRELILKSRPSSSLSPPARQSTLLIRPAGPPP